jgi:hypothetical protein
LLRASALSAATSLFLGKRIKTSSEKEKYFSASAEIKKRWHQQSPLAGGRRINIFFMEYYMAGGISRGILAVVSESLDI